MQKATIPTLLLHATVACTVVGCGGGGNSAPEPAPQPITLTGKVIGNQSIQGATVCLDLNANQQCDTGEPASAITGKDGAYSLTTDPGKTTAAQAAAAPFAALLPASAVDAANPSGTVATQALVLTAPASKGSQINPLTTLVQTGVASGLTLADAEAAVAKQMGITTTDVYDYQSQPAFAAPYQDNARTMAQVVLVALDRGQPLSVVGLATSQAASKTLRALTYTDANNYMVRTMEEKDAGAGMGQGVDKRYGLTDAVATIDAALYVNAYLTPTGWVRCSAAPFSATRGKPSRSEFCSGGQHQVGYNVNTDVSGKKMGDVIRQIQADSSAAHNFNLNPALVDDATFPSGSAITQRRNLELGQSIYVSNLNSTSEYLTSPLYASLETFIQGRQNANVNLATNTGMIWLGYTGDTNHWLLGAFIDNTSKVQYYNCTLKTTNGSLGLDVCAASTQGAFSIVTQAGKRLIKFTGQPDPVDNVSYTVGYAEYGSGVMVRFRETKPNAQYLNTASNRLNGVAGEALLKALGL